MAIDATPISYEIPRCIPVQPQSVTAAQGQLGVFQIKVQIPSTTRSSAAIPLTITVGGKTSQPGVTIAVGAGVSLSADRLSFGSDPVGTTSWSGTVTLTNVGATAVNFTGSGITIAGTDQGDFSISASTCGAGVAAGASCTISITFKPTATGARGATLDVNYSGGGSPQTVILSGTGT